MTDVTFYGDRKTAKAILKNVLASLAGRSAGNEDLIEGVYISVGFAALGDIQDNFLVLARKGVGVDGTKWKPLSPKTLAYGRKAPKAGGLAPGGNDGMLTPAQLKRWRQIYASKLSRFAASMDLGEAKSFAAAVAWNTIKAEGAKTKLAEYANRPHEIGRDTGVLLNSLSPGQMGGNSYSAPENQVFERFQGGIIVGTNVEYAKHFDRVRPIIPDEIPQQWIDSWTRTATRAVSVAFRLAITRGAVV